MPQVPWFPYEETHKKPVFFIIGYIYIQFKVYPHIYLHYVPVLIEGSLSHMPQVPWFPYEETHKKPVFCYRLYLYSIRVYLDIYIHYVPVLIEGSILHASGSMVPL